jgi:hypothetical protein
VLGSPLRFPSTDRPVSPPRADRPASPPPRNWPCTGILTGFLRPPSFMQGFRDRERADRPAQGGDAPSLTSVNLPTKSPSLAGVKSEATYSVESIDARNRPLVGTTRGRMVCRDDARTGKPTASRDPTLQAHDAFQIPMFHEVLRLDIACRRSLRRSSLQKPRHPLYTVFFFLLS